jgi:hypothetical protein
MREHRFVGGPNDNVTVWFDDLPNEIKLTKDEYDFSNMTVNALLSDKDVFTKSQWHGVYRLAGETEGVRVYLWLDWTKE